MGLIRRSAAEECLAKKHVLVLRENASLVAAIALQGAPVALAHPPDAAKNILTPETFLDLVQLRFDLFINFSHDAIQHNSEMFIIQLANRVVVVSVVVVVVVVGLVLFLVVLMSLGVRLFVVRISNRADQG